MYEVDGPGGVPGRVGSGIGHVGSGMGSPKSPRLGGFQSCVCTVLFRDSKQNQIHQAARPYNVDLSETNKILEHREKRSELRLGSAFFGISEVDFLPWGYRIKELWKEDGFSMNR